MVVEPFATWPSSTKKETAPATTKRSSAPPPETAKKWAAAYTAADAGSLGVKTPPAHQSGAADSGYRAADAGSLGLTTVKSQAAQSKPPTDYTAADAGSLGLTNHAGPGWGPVEAKVRAQPIYSDPWTAADAGSLGLHELSERGDPDGTFTGNLRGNFDVPPGDGSPEGQVTSGREAVKELLKNMHDGELHYDGDGGTVQQDEFEIVELENGNYIVNLPGVIDLSGHIASIPSFIDKPFEFADNNHFGLDPYNRSARDTDKHAFPSSRSADVDDNVYAQMVREYILENLPQGANVMLVGHSFGGDTALDLASDPTFNNKETGVNVTHAVSAAYYNQPQFDFIQNDTQVLVLQNKDDFAVKVEANNPFLPPDFDQPRRPLIQIPGFGPPPPPPVTTPTDDIVVSQFHGGVGRDFGHHPDRYARHAETTDNRDIENFFASVGDSGYNGNGTVIAIDVSVPADPVVAGPTSGPPTGTTTTTTVPEGPGPHPTTPGAPPPELAQTPPTTVPGPTPGTTTTTTTQQG